MDKEQLSFGKFIILKRQEKELTARQLAKSIGISAVYMCDIEKDRKFAISDDVLKKIVKTLMLSEDEEAVMYDLIAQSRQSISPDLPEYIMENELVRTALRTARNNNISEEKWERFIKDMVKEE